MDTYNFSCKKGDTFNGVQFNIKVNKIPLNLNGSTITCTFKKYISATKTDLILSTVASPPNIIKGLTIIDPTNGIMQIDSRIFTIPAGKYNYEIRFQLANGTVKTYIKGIFTLFEDAT